MAEEPSLSYYLPIAGGRIIGFIPFPKGISAMWNGVGRGISFLFVGVSTRYTLKCKGV